MLTVMLSGDGLQRYVAGIGFDEEADFGTQDFVGLVGERISYAWVGEEPLHYLISLSGVNIYTAGSSSAYPACEDTTIDIGQLVIAGGDASSLESAIRRSRSEEALPAITGVVTNDAGTPLEDVRVHATDPDGNYLSMGRTDADGRYRIELAPGTVHLQAWSDSLRPSEVVVVEQTASGVTADLTMASAGTIAWIVRDADGQEIPAKVSVVPTDTPAPTAPAPAAWPRRLTAQPRCT